MKKIIFIISVFLLASNFALAQSVNDLDLKNGFRHFKFGSNPSQIKNIVKPEQQYSNNPNVTEYFYTGNDINYIFNVEVTNVSLTFFKNKLYNISISFGDMKTQQDFTLYDYTGIVSALEKTYGNNYGGISNNDGSLINGAVWDGKKIRLELVRTDYSKKYINPRYYGYISGYLCVYDKNLNNQMNSSNF